MVCDDCGDNEAVIHLTQIEDNESATAHLCEACAAAKGVEASKVPENFPLTDFLAHLGGSEETSDSPIEAECSFCGLSFQDFRTTGSLGCPHCYVTFEGYLRKLLRRVHGGTQHVGKVYLPPDPTASELEKRLEVLRRKLQRAVEQEDFERAAELRDQIHSAAPSA